MGKSETFVAAAWSSSVKPGDLRRFHEDAFFANEKEFNGKLFLVLSGEFNGVDILVDGILDEGWSQRIIEDHSEPVNETR